MGQNVKIKNKMSKDKCKAWASALSILLTVIVGPENVNGFFQLGVETVKPPALGQPINLEIVLPRFLPLFSKNVTNGLTLRRETPVPQQSPASPMSISIQLPGRLPFNPFRLFESSEERSSKSSEDYAAASVSKETVLGTRTRPSSARSPSKFDKGPDGISSGHDSIDPVENELSEETMMMNQQIHSLDEVLTAQMIQKNPTTTTNISTTNNAAFNFPSLPDLSALSQLFSWGKQSVKTLAVCNACKVAFSLFMNRARQGDSLEFLQQMATFGCTFFRISSSEMCVGLISRFGPSFHYIVMQKPSLTADRFCGISLQSIGCTTTDPNSMWRIDLNQYNKIPDIPDSGIPGDFPVRKRSISDISNRIIPKSIKTVKILQLTDIHIDWNYQEGANADCENEMCCHTNDGVAKPGKAAGHYGKADSCDLPFHSFVEALDHISSAHPDIQFVYMTGDLVPHNIWSTSAEGNIEVMANASRYIHRYFPNARIIPVIGNHDTHPVNMFSPFGVPADVSTDWLYAALARIWSPWLPKESIHNFIHAGFYDVEIDQYFRIIVLNTNLCYTFNFWQTFEHRDPSGHLRWLAKELQRSEDLGQFVHILGHVPPGQEDCWTEWSKNFYNIIDRYSGIVKAQFYGHTHFDEFRMVYQKANRTKPIVASFIGASLTPYTDLNPGYKIYYADGARGPESTWDILDHETFIYNLTDANLHPHMPPRWFRLYRATEAFQIPDVSPHSLNELIHRMSRNVSAFNTYYGIYHKMAEAPLKEGCDYMCRKQILCNMVAPDYGEYNKCIRNKAEDGHVLPRSVFERLEPPEPIAGSGQGARSSTSEDESPFKRALSFGRSLLSMLG